MTNNKMTYYQYIKEFPIHGYEQDAKVKCDYSRIIKNGKCLLASECGVSLEGDISQLPWINLLCTYAEAYDRTTFVESHLRGPAATRVAMQLGYHIRFLEAEFQKQQNISGECACMLQSNWSKYRGGER